MKQYQHLVKAALATGTYKPNRTAVDTISSFSEHYSIDLENGYPLLTTKKMDGFRWRSMIHELLWYLSGQEHIRELREKTGIWDEWADEDGRLDTAYGRFWRRYPIPTETEQLEGESWPDADHRWVNDEDDGRRLTFDQLQYIIDSLQENPSTRRLVVNAWHPPNAAISTLPPCHFTFVFNVQGDRLNLHLTQRSGDIALGIPFNIAAYSLLLKAIAQQTDFTPGTFSHTIVDAHVYCGTGERGEWYGNHLEEFQQHLQDVEAPNDFLDVRDWLEGEAPTDNEDEKDHIPNLLTQLSREPKSRPILDIAAKPVDALEFDDITLRDYESAAGLSFGIAE
ncbi:thymidylate synthase [Halosimplex pelagicum]|uniref:Thymidylate synthase n=1 Tax=Halosimplex pelagicum TaxID=869886 RepID=A0A7D5TBJ1_9EURY|nr:thymidylate synthase [Halosimplex pelagicum]QLH82109.1 thymidylate synthase [Halosimplex pelagicum]